MKLSTKILLAFSTVILFSVADTYTNYRLSLEVEKNLGYLSKSESIIRNSNKIHKTIIQMQSAFRGYMLTEDASFLDMYYGGLKDLPAYFSDQVALCKDNWSQTSLLNSIQALHVRWTEYANNLIELEKPRSLSSALSANHKEGIEGRGNNQLGRELNNAIEKEFIEFDKGEYTSRNAHSNALIASIRRTHTFSFIFITLTIVAGFVSAIFIAILISSRITSMVKIAENISQGKFGLVTDTGNDELTGLSKSLNIMSKKLDRNIRDLEMRNAELNKFAYVVSHDLKAPVRGIHNVVKWIEEDMGDELSPELKRYLDFIPQRTKRMEDLINGLLDYARISEKKHPEEIDMNLLVKEITNDIAPREFTIDISSLPIIFTERLKIMQVFTNLVSNAVRYTKSPSCGHIIIDCADVKDFYQFRVKDNGIGIAPEYHEKVFEIFQTLRDKNEQESTGVGLAIVKKIIEEKGGKISVISEVGEGTEMIFTWPKKESI